MTRLGIDLGTSGTKVVAVDDDGRIVASASATYALDTPRPGWAEQDPERWWTATAECVREVCASIDRTSVRAIGLSGQMHTLVMTDLDGRPTRPAISWADTRTEAQVRSFASRVPQETMRKVLGNPPATGFTALSLMWVQEHEPDVYERTARICLAKDFVRNRLTGEWATDFSDASATLLFDPFRRAWAGEVLDALEIDPDLLVPVKNSRSSEAGLTDSAAADLGLPAGLPVATGASDQAAAATGVGLVDPGTLLVTLGSGGQVFAPLDAPVADPQLRVHLFCHAEPDRWHLLGAVQNMGIALDWVRRTFDWSWAELYEEAQQAPAGAMGVRFLPYLTGERSPHMDPRARASWSGIALSHGPEHLARAAVEGAMFAVADAVSACIDAGAAADAIVVTGGGSEHALPRSILADVLGRGIQRAEVQDASALGAAVLAGAPVRPLERRAAEGPGLDAETHREAWSECRALYRTLRSERESERARVE